MRKKIYELYDIDGSFIREGTAIQLSEFVHCEESSIREATNKPSFMKMYVVKRTDRREPPPKKKNAEPEIDYSTNPYECLKRHLLVYGNTLVSFNPDKHIQNLLNEGIQCKVEKRIDRPITEKSIRKNKPKYNYYVEVIHARPRSTSI